MESDRKDHWTGVYETKAPNSVSWYQPAPEPSLRALERHGVPPNASFIDVGGGVSNLVDALLKRGWTDLTVLDIAQPALEAAKLRLGPDAGKIRWEVADITEWRPARKYDVWHDRAVFHFLTEAGQRQAYRRALGEGLAPGGLLIIATFALDGPERCSGLPVKRYDAAGLAREMGPELQPVDSWLEPHSTPAENIQSFNWCVFRAAP